MSFFPIVRVEKVLMSVDRGLLRLLGAAFGAHLVLAAAAFWMPEMGDLVMFKIWAHHAYREGIHRAYESPDFQYDWLPLYLYVSKLMGGAFHLLGFAEFLDPWGRGFAFLIKLPMAACHLVTGALVFYVGRILTGDRRQALGASAFFLFNPGLMLATGVFGFQDAFHTMLAFGAMAALLANRAGTMACLFALVCMTKPQAVIYLLPMGIFGVRQFGAGWPVKGGAIGLATAALALMPFALYGALGGVWEMYLGVAHVHAWLNGCAHNLWWLYHPAPPFLSDRDALVWGISGLQMGLAALGGLAAAVTVKCLRLQTSVCLLEMCALLGFGFFMVVTEIHENHLYAMFAFFAPLVTLRPLWRRLYALLSITFAANLFMTIRLLQTGSPLLVGGIRLSTVNALIHAVVLLLWLWDAFAARRADER